MPSARGVRRGCVARFARRFSSWAAALRSHAQFVELTHHHVAVGEDAVFVVRWLLRVAVETAAVQDAVVIDQLHNAGFLLALHSAEKRVALRGTGLHRLNVEHRRVAAGGGGATRREAVAVRRLVQRARIQRQAAGAQGAKVGFLAAVGPTGRRRETLPSPPARACSSSSETSRVTRSLVVALVVHAARVPGLTGPGASALAGENFRQTLWRLRPVPDRRSGFCRIRGAAMRIIRRRMALSDGSLKSPAPAAGPAR